MNLQSEIDKATKLFNSGKSLPVKKSVKILSAAGFDVKYSTYKGYKDTKVAGQRFVTSRKEVTYYEVIVRNNGQIVGAFDNSFTAHTAYSLTNFVLINVKY